MFQTKKFALVFGLFEPIYRCVFLSRVLLTHDALRLQLELVNLPVCLVLVCVRVVIVCVCACVLCNERSTTELSRYFRYLCTHDKYVTRCYATPFIHLAG